MAFYNKYILPRLINLAMKNPATTECRSHIVPRATGCVLDVGIGSGLNLRFYGPHVTKLWGIDPSSELLELARPNLVTGVTGDDRTNRLCPLRSWEYDANRCGFAQNSKNVNILNLTIRRSM